MAAILGTAVLALATFVGAAPTAGSAPPDDETEARPNIVFILMDDFSTELLETMPTAQQMKAEGASYDNSFVIDSLCCPSRAALLTGQAPHQTGVLTNTPNDPDNPIGGYEAFEQYGNTAKQFSVTLQDSGYTTGFIGKFMNRYEAKTVDGELVAPPKVQGWSDWEAILGGGYNGWGYKSTYLDDNGDVQLRNHPKPALTQPVEARDQRYATNVAADKAIDFIERHDDEDAPYFLEIATYGPHSQLQAAYPDSPQFPSAFADRAPAGDPTGGNCGLAACGDLTLDDLVGYGDDRTDNAPTYLHRDGRTSPAPAWRTNEVSLTDDQALTRYRDRARMVQSIDRLIARVRAAVGPNTYVFLTADNGFHLGQHQLNGGKGTPYDSDSRVPLVVVGPDVQPGARNQFVNNIDLAPTFEALAGVESPAFRAGNSFAGSLSAPKVAGGRYAFFEHTYAKTQPGEVDTDQGSGGTIDIIPSFIAVRSARGLLVRFDLDNAWTSTDHAWELYRYDVPWEDRNVFAEDHAEPWVQDLKRRIERFDGCRPAVCRSLSR
ncbi:hypothetical protein ASD66_02050 [Nocardioides sp. Root151]|nr:hypothetical protein ASD30_08585 [Nocardioides sp. Root140]KQZ75177.1 hypothetical protein ASD66_02050 [Nocardioides sp. Root151]KRF14255.1 hypothetical protein ASH02_07845 [Nocardioides sp. Soil796]